MKSCGAIFRQLQISEVKQAGHMCHNIKCKAILNCDITDLLGSQSASAKVTKRQHCHSEHSGAALLTKEVHYGKETLKLEKHMSARYQKPKFASTYSEYFHDQLEISVVGRVSSSMGYMRDLGFDEFSLKTLAEGYVIPLGIMPPGIFQPNNSSAISSLSGKA